MPIKSEQQRRFMAMCLHSPEKAKDKCPPKGVAKKFIYGHKRKDEMNYHYNSYFSKVISEVNYSRYDRGRHQRRDVTPEEIGAKRHHFLDTNDPAKHVGELAITRALANPQATGGPHPYASDIGNLHSLATHYERRMKDAQMYLDKHPLADKTRYKNDAHARSSFKKWGGHLHALHNDVLRAYHHASEQGYGLPEDFKGLNQSHVEEHANKRGIDISQPFDAEAFRAKVRDFSRHESLVGDTNHPLYQGWKAPAKSPKGNAEEAAKQARMPQPPTREDASKNIKNLFMSIVEKFETDLTETGMLMTPALVNAPLPSKFRRILAASRKIKAHGEGEEGQAGPTGAVNTLAAAIRNRSNSTGHKQGSDQGSHEEEEA